MSKASFPLADDGYFLQHLPRIATELVEQALLKRRDYGSSVGYHGSRGLIPRIADKFFRLDALVWNAHAPNFESAEDTARDLATYAMMLAMVLEYERYESRAC